MLWAAYLTDFHPSEFRNCPPFYFRGMQIPSTEVNMPSTKSSAAESERLRQLADDFEQHRKDAIDALFEIWEVDPNWNTCQGARY